MALQRRGRISCDRRPPRRSPAPRIGPAQARLIAVLACPLGIALLARMAGWPLGGTALVALAVLCGYLVFAVARRVGGATLVSAGQLATLTPLEFERYVAAWFRARGYRAERCGGRGDGGVLHDTAAPTPERKLVEDVATRVRA